ncbi:hypothetical protein, partial [Hyphomonas sp.]
MKLRVRSELFYDFPHDTQAIFAIQVARSTGQAILSESLTLSPDTPVIQDMADIHGERRFRAAL